MNNHSKIASFIDSLPVQSKNGEMEAAVLSIGAGVNVGETNKKTCSNGGDCRGTFNYDVCMNTGDCSLSTNESGCSNGKPGVVNPGNTGNCASQSQLCQ